MQVGVFYSKIDLSGYFSTDGVTLITNNSTVYQCSSNHLTSFAVLVDVSGVSSITVIMHVVYSGSCSHRQWKQESRGQYIRQQVL